MLLRTLFYITILLLFAGCGGSGDNPGCGDFEVQLLAPADPGPAYWAFLSDESGALLGARRLEREGQHTIAADGCGERYDLTILQEREEEAIVNGSPATVRVYDATTFAGVSNGLEFDRTDEPRWALRSFTIQGVQSLELLLWPEESLETFPRDAFLNPTTAQLSFEIPVAEGGPAFLIIRANGEAENRFIWVDAVDGFSLEFDYGVLERLVPFGPVTLPNDGDWRYFIDGVGEFGATRLDYSSLPDQVSFEFGAALPPAELLRAYRLTARQEQFKDGTLFFPIYFEKELPGLPASIPAPPLDIEGQRIGTASFQVSVTEGQPTALSIRLQDNMLNAGAGPWLRWTVYGPPDALADFRLPDWPAELEALRAELLDDSRSTPAIVQGYRYDSRPSYQEFLEARARKDEGWDARQGLEARSKGL